MVDVRTVDAWLVAPRYAARVVGPAYDALLPEQRRALADADPDSFFNVVRSPLDEPGADDEGVLEGNARTLRTMLTSGRYRRQPPALYLYRLLDEGHRQTAVVGDLAVRDVAARMVRAHERTRTAKEAELARYLGHMRVHSSPVGLGYRARPAIDALVGAATEPPPDLDFVSSDGLRQQIWSVHGAAAAELQAAFAEVDATYIIDGHHRVAATGRVDGDGRFLAALIPDHELRLLPYHRVIAGPLPADLGARLASLEGWSVTVRAGQVGPGERPPAAPHAPEEPEAVVLYAHHTWYDLHRRTPLGERLAAAAVDEEVLAPVLGVLDPRTDPRLSFVAGRRDPAAVAAVAHEQGGAAILLSAPTLDQVFHEADLGRALPPKSTWFEPKLRSGIFVVPR